MDRRINSKELFNHMVKSITIDETRGEIGGIVYLVLHSLFGVRREQIMAGKELTYDQSELDEIIKRINSDEPVQYILNEAEFYGRLFWVDKNVLIPRPETELLVKEVIDYAGNKPVRILDIGTGSGCIAVTLGCELENATVSAVDISNAAIDVAYKNSLTFNTSIEFVLCDALTDELPKVDIIVSNPPYIEKSEVLKRNVYDYEPHIALFVDDPLIFYKSIATRGRTSFVEINERFGREVKSIFDNHGFKTEIIKDIDNKDRIIKAIHD